MTLRGGGGRRGNGEELVLEYDCKRECAHPLTEYMGDGLIASDVVMYEVYSWSTNILTFFSCMFLFSTLTETSLSIQHL